MAEKPELISVDQAAALGVDEMAALFGAHISPGQLYFFKRLGFDKVKIERAKGMYYFDQNGRKILDFFGGFGAIALGHNHPRVLAARKKFLDEDRHDIALAFVSQYSSALAANLAACSPGDLDMVFLGTSGSEAMEAAVKLAERAAGTDRPKIVYAENSFHGKTKGVLAVTDGALYRATFTLPQNTVRIPFGDIESVRRAFSTDPKIGTIVLETVQGGGGIIQAPREYWQQLRALCDEYGVLWVADEVQCGFGRTGRFYAFEHYDVVPDITALAKSLGGSKSAVGAMIARRDVYLKAYGTKETALIHAGATLAQCPVRRESDRECRRSRGVPAGETAGPSAQVPTTDQGCPWSGTDDRP
jgi:acetylornithine/succinyldiaminopimelate/putrescine aminotransferase